MVSSLLREQHQAVGRFMTLGLCSQTRQGKGARGSHPHISLGCSLDNLKRFPMAWDSLTFLPKKYLGQTQAPLYLPE